MIFKNALPRDIHISGSCNGGFIVICGCSTSVFTDKKAMLNAIEDYINDPQKLEQQYNESDQGRLGPTAIGATASAAGQRPRQMEQDHMVVCCDEQGNKCR